MRLICLFCTVLVVSIASTGRAGEQPADFAHTMKAMNDLRVAEIDAMSAFVRSSTELKALLLRQPDIEDLSKSIDMLESAQKNYEASAVAVRRLLAATKGISWEAEMD